ncbi:oxidation resistance protein 1 isoform X5 [Schistocerca serialis cubense]|uniref:oxidation resistance protein 1 isoform X5 n=1 Tax=Schistocerca serialis cubense TaxID=2023355 RepID=UPI00214E639C|nr:oxidation resistance protein 1 isoform X5 [Schistocerca serialis cubense]
METVQVHMPVRVTVEAVDDVDVDVGVGAPWEGPRPRAGLGLDGDPAASSSSHSLPLVLESGADSAPELGPPSADKRGRRKSWHIKMERKRRKGVIGNVAAADRQKRPSWWNIFVPDHWPRSRRASQDLSRPTESGATYLRSKSRSVDHGFVAPFDLDSLRSKVEGRFESVDKLSRSDSDGGGPGKDGAPLGERRPASAPPPIETTTYTVAANDTLTSVAARFDTTPSELAKLNRLGARLIFPGQVLRVPLRGPAADSAEGADRQQPQLQPPAPAHPEGQLTPAAAADAARPSAETDILESLRPVSPKPTGPPVMSEATHPSHPDTTGSSGASLEEQRAERRFLKINVRHITDGQGVVGGVLLVTPNAVMFDPNVSDPLVIEHGPEMYGVIAPMEYVVNAAIYYDIAHMRVGHHTGDNKRADTPKPEIYHSKAFQTYEKGQNSPGKDSLLVKDETFPELAGPARSSPEDNESECSCPGREDGDAFPKAFERDLVTPTNLATTVENGTDADSRQVSFESCTSGSQTKDGVEETTEADDYDYDDDDIIKALRSAEERRRSCIDHHWAVPSSERDRSLEKDELEADGERNDTAVSAPCDGLLEKHSCHDSGIDIREVGALGDQAQPPGTHSVQEQQEDEEEEIPIVLPSKKVFSDADIILAPKTEWVPPRTVSGPTHVHMSQDSPPVNESGRKKTSSVSFSLDSNQEGDSGSDKGEEGSQKSEDPEKQESRKNKMLKRLSYPLSWMEGITGEKDDKDPLVGLPTPSAVDAQQHSSMFSKVFSRRSSVGTFIRQQQEPRSAPPQKPVAPKLDYRSMVSVEDMPELFVSFDKLIPRPARSCEDPPLYLTLRMGKPLNKKIPKSTPIMSYGKKKMRPEYWFSVPRNRVDELYSFLMLWIPHLYGDLEEIDFKSRGYELVESDTELWDDEVGDGNGRTGDSRSRSGSDGDAELGELTRESWEVIKAPYVKLYSILKTVSSESEPVEEVLSMSEELRRALYANNSTSIDLEFTLPELSGTTEILSEEHRRKLCRHLPARAEGYVWTLVFSTSQHGFSLNSMYRKMNRLESPILLVIEDTENNVFGALTSCALKVSDHFYGTGESLLFRFTPEFQVFNWTGDNLYFIKGNNESLSIGAGDGKFGLWLDGDLYQGRTEPCSTYGNEPLTPQKDFVVKTLECWAFI